MPTRKNRNPAPNRQQEKRLRQSRKVSREAPEPKMDTNELAGNNPRSFSQTDAEERPDTNRRIGRIPAGSTGQEREQAEFDEDGGGPRQANSPSEGGPPYREHEESEEALVAETGGTSGLEEAEEEANERSAEIVTSRPRAARSTKSDTARPGKGRKQSSRNR